LTSNILFESDLSLVYLQSSLFSLKEKRTKFQITYFAFWKTWWGELDDFQMVKR